MIHCSNVYAKFVGIAHIQANTGATTIAKSSQATDKRSVSNFDLPRHTSDDTASMAETLSCGLANLSIKGQKNLDAVPTPKPKITENELESARSSLRSVIGD